MARQPHAAAEHHDERMGAATEEVQPHAAPAPAEKKDSKLDEARATLTRHLGSAELVAALEEFIKAVK